MTRAALTTDGSDRASADRAARRLSWAWFAGADGRVLSLVPSERSFLEAQGLVIVAMAGVTGFAVAVAASGWWNVPLAHVAWLGAVWTALICVVDRLIYKSFGTSRIGNLALALPRAALSLVLALVLGLPMVQFIFAPSISNRLTKTAAVDEKHARQAALAFYEPRIKLATEHTATIRAHETALENRVSRFTRLSGCENDDPSCSRTHRTGCGHWCRYYATQAKIARASLAAARPADRKKVALLKARIADWQRAETRETSTRVGAIAANRDLLARADALSAIEREHPDARRYVLFVLGLFVCLDLVALVMKLSHLFVTRAVYEEVAAELRERDRLEAHRLRTQTKVARDRITTLAESHS